MRLEFATEDSVAVTVSGEGLKPETRRFSIKAGEARCDRGRLELAAKRWVASDLMSGRESVKIELNQSDPFLVAHVYESPELFGADSPWQKAGSVRLEFATEDSVEVTVSGEGLKPATRRFSLKAGEARCDRGRLTFAAKRWVASDLMSGREKREDRAEPVRSVPGHARV